MFSLSPSLDAGDASANLSKLLADHIDASRFESTILRLQKYFDSYCSTCPEPFIAPGLFVTPEIRRQSELYLPMEQIEQAFNRLYRAALRYSPILSSTVFHNSLSWADVFMELPPHLQLRVNPAYLLERLITNRELLTGLLFASFLPGRFYGGFGRYPKQLAYIRDRFTRRNRSRLRCLDAACGTGEDSYGLANLFDQIGFDAELLRMEGWTIEPLEVWAAAHCCFPCDRQREARFRAETARLFERGYDSNIRFSCVNLRRIPSSEPFDLILCNGLLGGPIVNQLPELKLVAGNLASLLAPGGILLAADTFHDGWKQKCPQRMLRALFEANGLKTFQAGEGIGGLKPD